MNTQQVIEHTNQDTIHDITIIHPMTPQQIYEVYQNCHFVNAFLTLEEAQQYRANILDDNYLG